MAGVDIANQFPNSRMAKAVKLGQSRFRSVDVPSTVQTPSQDNVSIAVATGLAVPAGATYAVLTAVGGPMYVTYDGSVPSAANFAISIASGNSLPVQGVAALAAVKVQGTSISVSYWS